MADLSRQAILNRLKKLREFIERDCGNESKNAKILADRLIAKYGISSSEFSYTVYAEKVKEDQKKQANEKAWYEAKQERQRETVEYRVSYTSCMKDVVTELCRFLGLRYTVSGAKIFVYCTSTQYADFSRKLKDVKHTWFASLKVINNQIISKLDIILKV
jgi:hypothetical protein